MAANTTRVVAPSPGHDPSAATSPTVAPRAQLSSIPKHNLRSTAISLAERLEQAGKMSVSTLTDFVLSNPVHDPASAARRAGVCTDIMERDTDPDLAAAIERNSRRRVYDAVKVIVAVGLASRSADKKELVWRGRSHIIPPCERALPSASSSCSPPPCPPSHRASRPAQPKPEPYPPLAAPSSPASDDPEDELALEKDLALYTSPGQPQAEASSCSHALKTDVALAQMTASTQLLRASLQEKRALRKSLSVRVSAFTSLRNRISKKDSSSLGRRISLPFVLVRGNPTEIRQSSGKSELEMKFLAQPILLSESDVVLLLEKALKTKKNMTPNNERFD